MSNIFIVLDQAAGQKQIEILDVFKQQFQRQVIIAGNINQREKKLGSGVKWEKTIKYNRKNYFTRIYTWLVYTIHTFFIILFKYRNAHLFIITNPPTSIFLTLFLPNRFNILVFDLYPDSFVEYGMMSERSLIYRFWASMNVLIFRRADRIYTLGESMANRLSNYIPRDRIEIVELWTDSNFLVNTDTSSNWFVEKYNLKNKFVVMYSGNMGITHPVELMVDLAFGLKHMKEIVFVAIGGGHKFPLIQERSEKLGLDNILIMPFLKPADLPFSFNAASMGVVTLDSKAGELSVPSKVFDLFAVGVPVLGIGSDSSELSRLLRKYDCGKCFPEKNLHDMIGYIKALYNDKGKYEMLCINSKHGSTYHTPENAKYFL